MAMAMRRTEEGTREATTPVSRAPFRPRASWMARAPCTSTACPGPRPKAGVTGPGAGACVRGRWKLRAATRGLRCSEVLDCARSGRVRRVAPAVRWLIGRVPYHPPTPPAMCPRRWRCRRRPSPSPETTPTWSLPPPQHQQYTSRAGRDGARPAVPGPATRGSRAVSLLHTPEKSLTPSLSPGRPGPAMGSAPSDALRSAHSAVAVARGGGQ